MNHLDNPRGTSAECAISTSRESVLFSGFAWPHHDAHSGYHHVVPPGSPYVDGGRFWGYRQPLRSFGKRVNYVLIDLATLVRGFRANSIVYFYPEQTALVSPLVLSFLRKRIVFVLHLSHEYWLGGRSKEKQGLVAKYVTVAAMALRRLNLFRCDTIIVLSSAHQEAVKKGVSVPVICLPHGIYPQQVSFDEDKYKASRSIVVIGDNYRDYDLLAKIVQRFEQTFPSIVFKLIGMKASKLGATKSKSNVLVLPRLSPEEYMNEIRGSLFVLLPLRYSTANNALLEALSVGVPVATNLRQVVCDYLPDDTGVFENLEQLQIFTQALLDQTGAERNASALKLMAFVEENLSWAKIRPKVLRTASGS